MPQTRKYTEEELKKILTDPRFSALPIEQQAAKLGKEVHPGLADVTKYQEFKSKLVNKGGPVDILDSGKILTFPKNTSDEEINKTAQSYIPAPDPRDYTYKTEQNKVKSILTNPTVQSGAAGAALGLMSGGIGLAPELASLIGTGGMEALNYIQRKQRGEESKFPISSTLGVEPQFGVAQEIGENTALSELIGKGIEWPIKKGGAALFNLVKEKGSDTLTGKIRDKVMSMTGSTAKVGPGSVVKESVSKLKPTYAQYADSIPGARFIEDIFSPLRKEAALDVSGSLTRSEAEKLAQQISGRRALFTLDDSAALMQNQAQADFANALVASSDSAENLKMLAASPTNKVTLTKTVTPATTAKSTNLKTGMPQTVNIPAVTKDIDIEGPVTFSETGRKLLELQSAGISPLDKPDPNNKLFNSVNNLLESLGYDKEKGTFENGIHGFEEAWATKKKIGLDAFENVDDIPDYQRKGYKEIYHALDEDIENSMKTWKDSKPALASWNKTKQIVNKTYDNFFPEIETGKAVRTLLSTKNAPDKAINAIADDHEVMQRFLNTGEMTVNIGGKKEIITASNKRKELQSYQFMRMFHDAWQPLNPAELKEGLTNGSKLVKNVASYLDSHEGKLLFNAKNRSDITQFVNDAAQVSSKGVGEWSQRNMILRLGTGAIALTGGIADVMTGGTLSRGAGMGAGVIGLSVGLNQIGKLLTNPDTARLLIAMNRNAPLGMSPAMAGRFIANALRNQPVSLENQEGIKIGDGKINTLGKFEPNKVAGNVGNEYSLK